MWDEDNRQKKKATQSKNWFRKGGFDVPLFVPCTPGGELAKRMTRMEALNNQGRTIRFRVVERRGVTLEEKLRRSNPWAGERCGRPNCFPCQTDEGGNCWREGITSVRSVERRWQPILASLGAMVILEEEST